MRRCLPGFLLASFLACDPAGSGCQLTPLQRDLDLSSLGQQAIEFYLPPGSGPVLSQVILGNLSKNEADRLCGSLPVLTGSLGGPLEFVSTGTDLEAQITGLETEIGGGKILVKLGLESVEKNLSLEVFTDGTLLRNCFIDVVVPPRQLTAGLIVDTDYSGKLRIRVEGQPLVSNGSVTTELELDCPEQPGSELDATVIEAVETVYSQAAELLTADLAEATTQVLGLDAGLSASVGPAGGDESAHLMVHTGPYVEVLPEGTLRIGLTGGVESEQATCIPPGAAELPPADEPGAEFKNFVPLTGEAYAMGISISHGFLAQSLAATYRGGLLCRMASAGDLTGVDLGGLFEFLDDFANPDKVRAALWPGRSPVLEFTNPALNEGEMLPRAVLQFEALTVDIYSSFEGADVRLLGLTANATVELAPVLDGQSLYFWPAKVTVRDLEVSFSKLITESANLLRSTSAQPLERVLSPVVENIPPVEIPRPAGAAGELMGAESVDGRLVLYFNP